MGVASDIVIGLVDAPVCSATAAVIYRRLWPRIFRGRFMRIWLSGWITGSASGVGFGIFDTADRWFGAACAVSLTVAVAVWWWRRKKRRTAAQLLGAKTRALRDALVAQMPKPRPVLQPVRQPS